MFFLIKYKSIGFLKAMQGQKTGICYLNLSVFDAQLVAQLFDYQIFTPEKMLPYF
jgi:hypothetical protein